MLTSCHLAALTDGVAQAESWPAKPHWDKKAAAHAAVIGQEIEKHLQILSMMERLSRGTAPRNAA